MGHGLLCQLQNLDCHLPGARSLTSERQGTCSQHKEIAKLLPQALTRILKVVVSGWNKFLGGFGENNESVGFVLGHQVVDPNSSRCLFKSSRAAFQSPLCSRALATEFKQTKLGQAPSALGFSEKIRGKATEEKKLRQELHLRQEPNGQFPWAHG